MKVCLFSGADELLWSRDAENNCGITSTNYLRDGTQCAIVGALVEALDQAVCELGGALQIIDAVTDIRPAAAKIDCRIPVSIVRDGDSRREHLEAAAVEAMAFARAKVLKVDVIHHADIALMGAADNDNIAS